MDIQVVVVFNNLPGCPPKMRKAAGRRIHASGFRVDGDAKGRAPVDTGAMRASIVNTPSGDLSTVIGVGVEYAGFVELGTRKMAAQPFLRPALDAEYPRLIASFHGIEGEIT